jgi:hypothetical protein
MIAEFDVFGVFVPVLLVWTMLALAICWAVRRLLVAVGFYRLVWHRPLFDVALLVIILAGVTLAVRNLP